MRLLLPVIALIAWHATYIDAESSQKRFKRTELDEDPALTAIADRTNAFAAYFHKFFSRHNRHNILIAPAELLSTLWVAGYAPEMISLKRVTNAFPLPFDKPSVVQRGLEKLNQAIASYESIGLTWTNRIYLCPGFEPSPSYRETMRRFFRADVQTLDFRRAAESRKTIDERIVNVTGAYNTASPAINVDSNTAIVLVNAIYFKVHWARPFIQERNFVFHIGNNKKVRIPFMKQLDFFRYGSLESLDARFIEIIYAKNMSMFLILPNTLGGLEKVEQNIDKIKLSTLLEVRPREILLKMPMFVVSSQMKNAGTFDATQKAIVYGDAAVPPQNVSHFVQRIVFTLDATCVEPGMINASPMPATPIFRVNRPFVGLIATTGEDPFILLTVRYAGTQ